MFEEKLKEKSIPLMQKYMWIDQPTEMQKEQVILLKDAISICKSEIAEACKKAKIEENERWVNSYYVAQLNCVPTNELKDRIKELKEKL